MRYLKDIASLIRSKNAKAFVLTFDIMFDNHSDYETVARSGALNRMMFARLYKCPEASVKFFECPRANAFKFTIPRPRTQGDLGDADLHGGQQYVPLMWVEIP